MSADVAPLFDAALSLPEGLRAELAAQLIESLDGPSSQDDRTPDEWAAIIKERSDDFHRGESIPLDAGEVLAAARAKLNSFTPTP